MSLFRHTPRGLALVVLQECVNRAPVIVERARLVSVPQGEVSGLVERGTLAAGGRVLGFLLQLCQTVVQSHHSRARSGLLGSEKARQ